jgi:hypothetical protein
MLSFISFWRAAAIVLSDLASSAYYVGGIAETAIGKAAPWFILAIMLFSTRCAPSTSKAAACSCAAACTGGARGHGRHAGQVLRLRADVRLRAHRPHQRASAPACISAASSTNRRVFPSPACTSSALFRGRFFAVSGDALFLAQEHHRHPRIERKGAAHHADHHRHGGDPDRLVPGHDLQERLPARAAARPGQSHFSPRRWAG